MILFHGLSPNKTKLGCSIFVRIHLQDDNLDSGCPCNDIVDLEVRKVLSTSAVVHQLTPVVPDTE
jgi:hypothetical protein